MAKKIVSKEKEKQKKIYASYSRRVGLLSGIALYFTMILDAISLIWVIDTLSIIAGVVMLIIALIVLSEKFEKFLDEKVHRKDYLGQVIDTFSLSSVFVFVVERVFLPAVKMKIESPWMALFLIIVFAALPILVAVTLFTKKDAKYNVD